MASDDSDVDVDVDADLFQEPSDFYPPEKESTTASHQLLSGKELHIRLVGHNPLWGHFLWNAGRTISDFLEERASDLVKHKTVLELGAGGGLPSLVCSVNGASSVVVTDYPDHDLIENLQYNIDHCELLPSPPNIIAKGYLWGASTEDLTKDLPNGSTFDVLILADLLFNHSEHAKLIKTVQKTLTRSTTSRAYVFFTPYRPWLLQKDLSFFDLARDSGFVVEKTFEKVMDKVMFEEDPGDELLRRTVYGYELSWPSSD
ncbi:putative methyltransferase-domain-containing protein [Clohesyomyces aquaticus]|uniref:Protein N-terminal and lysine N-methyltransferase EFM7 n=1 Tax=Clohesyomyces aquaticus TaxID=1231657 RepID=A0A1Y1ZTS8_9PLEO|nr:putative methyltransferase-domain-containing protein [Clohesyomyces aquaticus]